MLCRTHQGQHEATAGCSPPAIRGDVYSGPGGPLPGQAQQPRAGSRGAGGQEHPTTTVSMLTVGKQQHHCMSLVPGSNKVPASISCTMSTGMAYGSLKQLLTRSGSQSSHAFCRGRQACSKVSARGRHRHAWAIPTWVLHACNTPLLAGATLAALQHPCTCLSRSQRACLLACVFCAGLPAISCPRCGRAVEWLVLARLYPQTLQQLEEALTNAWLQAHGVIR